MSISSAKSLVERTRTRRNLHGRRQTRALTKEKQGLIDALLPQLKANALTLPSGKPLWLEIGFGNGEHLLGLLKQYPGVNFIGAEPFVNGMATLLYAIKDEKPGNVLLWMDDALLLCSDLPDASIGRLYILNPDPWPKKRHHKRRIISQENLRTFSRILEPGGQMILSTDVSDLAEWMVTQVTLSGLFGWTAEKADDWRLPPPDWIPTRYEEKGRKKGRNQVYLIFKKLG